MYIYMYIFNAYVFLALVKQSAETVRQSIKAVLARTIQIVYKSFVKFHLYLIFFYILLWTNMHSASVLLYIDV